jgi:hypothetical protein
MSAGRSRRIAYSCSTLPRAGRPCARSSRCRYPTRHSPGPTRPRSSRSESQTAAGVLYDAVDATAADAEGVGIVCLAEVNAAELLWPAGITACQKTTALGQLRVIARRPDTIVGFGENRIHAETATFEVRASEVASPRPGISSRSVARPSSSKASPSGVIPIGWCGAWTRGEPEDQCSGDLLPPIHGESRNRSNHTDDQQDPVKIHRGLIRRRTGLKRRRGGDVLHIDDGYSRDQGDAAPLQRGTSQVGMILLTYYKPVSACPSSRPTQAWFAGRLQAALEPSRSVCPSVRVATSAGKGTHFRLHDLRPARPEQIAQDLHQGTSTFGARGLRVRTRVQVVFGPSAHGSLLVWNARQRRHDHCAKASSGQRATEISGLHRRGLTR